MADLEILAEMFRPEFQIKDSKDTVSGKKILLLKEENCPDSKVTLKNINGEVIAIKADAIPLLNFFARTRGECKSCDCIIFYETAQKKYIIIAELKQSKGHTREEKEQQLRGGCCLVKYFQAVGKAFWQEPGFLDEFTYRYVVFKDSGHHKRPTALQRPSSNDSPANHRTIYGKAAKSIEKLV